MSLSGKTLHIFFAVNIQVKLINCFMLCVLLWTLYIPLVNGIGPVCNSQTATLALPATTSVQHVCILVFVKPLTDIIHSW